MKFIKRSTRTNPRVSLILLDWSVRESFHLLHYLSRQNVERNQFEVIVVEYYGRVSEAIGQFQDQVDTWVLLEMPEDCYYHKHLMYNTGIVLSQSDICVICDSDAMVKDEFIRAIIDEFDRDPRIVLHMDQFRNMRRDFYPFNYPSFHEVLGEGCINNVNGKTRGILDIEDPIHTRNYGACMCARREDLISVGGADEHIDYLGHICGPYDMTFRLVNKGIKEVWHQAEFMYHTWHPGQAGVDNYLGPHDGRHVSTTALEALTSRRTSPLAENEAIRMLRIGDANDRGRLIEGLIRPENAQAWRRDAIEKAGRHLEFREAAVHVGNHLGFSVYNELGHYWAHLLIEPSKGRHPSPPYAMYFEADSLEEIKRKIQGATPAILNASMFGSRVFILIWQVVSYGWSKILWPAFRFLVVRPVSRVKAALFTLLQALRRRIAQFSLERRQLTNALCDMLPNLYHLRAARPDLSKEETPMLLVDSKRFQLCLKLIASLRILPPLHIVHIASAEELRALLSDPVKITPELVLIVSRAVYIKYYQVVASSGYWDRVAVI